MVRTYGCRELLVAFCTDADASYILISGSWTVAEDQLNPMGQGKGQNGVVCRVFPDRNIQLATPRHECAARVFPRP